ncbi:hypothetical protein HPB49_025042 [Dermacentor silvarum]|uniref:Uncharacterized protein n=1 Tax=Dermacentor silvarum TaxID=543639 RepID=A0ACB8CU04_DERSI|nr:hypothetical protein HPB49_025042 [Dermacentor silvarum]
MAERIMRLKERILALEARQSRRPKKAAHQALPDLPDSLGSPEPHLVRASTPLNNQDGSSSTYMQFSPQNNHLVNPIAYQPYGLGIRKCLGQRFAVLELLSVTAHVLRHFRISLGPSQTHELKLDTYAVMAVPKEKIWIKVHKLNNAK